jgi:hypothetical protein
VAEKVFAVLDGLISRGEVRHENDINAGVVARAWQEFYPGEKPPGMSTIRIHIRSWRSRRAPAAVASRNMV